MPDEVTGVLVRTWKHTNSIAFSLTESHTRAKKSKMNLHDSVLEASAPVFCCVDSVCCCCWCLYVCLHSLLVDNIHFVFCSSLVLLCFFFLLCMCRSLASVSDLSPMRSRSQSQEGDEQLGEVAEEEQVGAGGGGAAGKRTNRKEPSQAGGEGSAGRLDADTERREELLEGEDDLNQRSISETDLR